MSHLYDAEQYVVEQEPDERVNEEEGEPAPGEEHAHRPRGRQAEHDALRDRLQEDGRERDQRHP